MVVERSDVLEAIGQFVAAYLATMPEAQHLQPKQLQAALTQTFKVHRPIAPLEMYGLEHPCAPSMGPNFDLLRG